MCASVRVCQCRGGRQSVLCVLSIYLPERGIMFSMSIAIVLAHLRTSSPMCQSLHVCQRICVSMYTLLQGYESAGMGGTACLLYLILLSVSRFAGFVECYARSVNVTFHAIHYYSGLGVHLQVWCIFGT